MPHVKILVADTVHDGEGGYYAPGAIVDAPADSCRTLIDTGLAEGAEAPAEDDMADDELNDGVTEIAPSETPRPARRRKPT